jgi:hypothetical protein
MMPVVGDPHDAEELFGADDVEDEAPFRDEHPVGEEAGGGADADERHALQAEQTGAVDETQEDLAKER